MKAGVDPTEEKGVLHPFLPPRGDPCLLFATRAQELFLLLLSRVAHSPPLVFPFPLHIGSREEGRVMWEYMCAGWESGEEMHLGVYIVYTLKAMACFNYSLPMLTAWESFGFYGK